MQQFLRCEHTQHEIKESGVDSKRTFTLNSQPYP